LKKMKGIKSLPGSSHPVCSQKMVQYFHQRKKREVPQCTLCPGVFTLEAAVVLPLLACFFVTLLFFFRVLQVQLIVQDTLNRTGRLLAVYASGEKGEEMLEQRGAAVATAFVLGDLKNEPVIVQMVSGGASGISLLRSKFTGNVIELVAESNVKLPVELLGKRTVRLTWHVVCRKWTGWDAQGGSGDTDTWVYVTDTGQVYHRYASCTYLTLSITSVAYDSIDTLRNENGERYYECQRCAGGNVPKERVYITNQGNRYHYDLNCSGIKRTVYMIRLSEAGNKRPCSRCSSDGTQTD
jgi:hypothetical protein